ncbi:MAG TPA: hypothetical protein PLR20_09355 [Syntrophales bacterium]|nr:hypothetical protein [Syntrophales bacterium]HOX93919.1 hypothetical protein [Syntrophales bacterium]HPI57972.1 hypothetical protein [Syntrophales bacterium]HPN25900.1 hypothetical protein [Syntrophales bacterium]HQM29544.1 hypothetical protein [Syntrophales bacterium]
MNKMDKLLHIKYAALYIEPRLVGSDFELVKAAEEEWMRLADQLYEDNKRLITPRQYQAARTQFEYFLVLLEMTIDHHRWEAPPSE